MLVVLAFVVIAPLLVLYAKGYSFRPDDRSVILTGTILVDTNISKVQVSLDGQEKHTENDPVILRGLEPGTHHLSITREGYEPWESDLEVTPEKVTRVDDVLLALSEPEIEQPINNEIGRFAVSPNSRFIAYTVTEGKDTGLWMHTNGNEENRRLLSLEDDIDVITLRELRWSDNSRLLLIRDEHNAYWRILPHTGNPSALALDHVGGIVSARVILDQDEPSTVYYRDDTDTVFRWATARNNALPELIARDVIDFAVANPKVFILSRSKSDSILLESYDVRESAPSAQEIATLPAKEATLVVQNAALVSVIADSSLQLLKRINGIFAFEPIADQVSYAEWSEDGLFLAYQSNDELWIHDQEPLEDQPSQFKIIQLAQQPSKIAWHPDGRHVTLYTSTSDGMQIVSLVHAARNAPLTQQIAQVRSALRPQFMRGGADLVYTTKQPEPGLVLHTFTEKVE
ncbi:MAG: PEGA domain-containing protein [bacterium]|nr:PEGA domain-containing protein [bacterium]